MQCSPSKGRAYKRYCGNLKSIPRRTAKPKKGCHTGVYYYYLQLKNASKGKNTSVSYRYNNAWFGSSEHIFIIKKPKNASKNSSGIWMRIKKKLSGFGSGNFEIRINEEMNKMQIYGGKKGLEYGARCDVPKLVKQAGREIIERKNGCLGFTEVKKKSFYPLAKVTPLCRNSILKRYKSIERYCNPKKFGVSQKMSSYDFRHGACKYLVQRVYGELVRYKKVHPTKITYRPIALTLKDNECSYQFVLKGRGNTLLRVSMDTYLRSMSIESVNGSKQKIQYGADPRIIVSKKILVDGKEKRIKVRGLDKTCLNRSQFEAHPLYKKLIQILKLK
ncbi:MAG: hypothetical protein ABIE74_00925 [Pseudomonadota bacterium]